MKQESRAAEEVTGFKDRTEKMEERVLEERRVIKE